MVLETSGGGGPASSPPDSSRTAFIGITGPLWGPLGRSSARHSVCNSSRSTAQGPPCWALCCCAQRRGRCLLLRHSPHRASSLAAAAGNGKGATACGRWWGLPSGPLGRPTRPQRPAGRTPAHPGRRAAARPVHPPAGAGRGNVAAKAGPLRAPARSSWPPAVARGHPSAMQGQAPTGPLAAGLALLLPRAGCGAGAPGRPGPHCVGAVGPSAPPAPPFGRA